MSGKTDFNDLHLSSGLKEVRRQLLLGIKQGPVITDNAHSVSPSAPPAGYFELKELDIEHAIARFIFTIPGGKIWDSHSQMLLKKLPAKDLMGKSLFDEWMVHPKRRTGDEANFRPLADAAAVAGGGGYSEALRRYVYLYPTTDVWDRVKKSRVPINALKHALADCFDPWIKSDRREQIDVENLVFDPTQQADPETHINSFRGLPRKPLFEPGKCDSIYQLVLHLCNEDKAIFDWLMKWLAFPLQHVGSKMASAVLMHSQKQGSGKSLFFEEIIKPLYGEYAKTLGQHQLESKYTDWQSELLFGLFEEIFSRDEKYSHTGTLKHMITGKTQRIEKKFVSGWEESNFMNAVFLSNEIQPFPVEPNDRRMLVIWPKSKMPEDLKKRVLDEIANGGIDAFYAFLLSYPTKDFGTHSEPPITDAKESLIDFGRPAWEVFFRDWKNNDVEVPYMPCLSDQLFSVYRRWCERRREHVVSQTKFSGFLATQEDVRRRRDVHYDRGQGKAKGVFFIPKEPDEPFRQGEDENQSAWLGRCFQKFAEFMSPGPGEQ